MTVVDRYLAELERALHGPRRDKRDLVSEARDHLTDDVEARVDAGAPLQDAQRESIREFGPVRDIAPAYQAVLSAGQCRRISLWLIVLVVTQPLAWDFFGALPISHGSYDHPSTLYTLADSYVEVVGATAAALAITVVVAGRFAVRRAGVREWMLRFVLTAVLVSTGALMLVSTAMLLSSGQAEVLNIAYAAVVSWLPMCLLGTACVRALRALDLAVAAGAPAQSTFGA
ncbi:MAG TPA: permease prefix domain 1-containing protein [Nocardioidaceae bacterium]|nr:permease prefix domain 1-containing protein [Nocardioidaceae bacterium]